MSAPLTLNERAEKKIIRRRHIEQGLQEKGYQGGEGPIIRSNYFDLAMVMDYWSDKALNHHTEATSMLYAARECARILSEDRKRVVVVDTSNEIAGDGDVPHHGIGHARRMPVSDPALQHAVMIEAVENHMPEVIIIDEIGNEAEALAVRTIAERGVQLIGTAHGQTLENLMLNPSLADLIGGIQAVTLSDAEAQRRGTQKTVLERKSPPTFDVVIELLDYD